MEKKKKRNSRCAFIPQGTDIYVGIDPDATKNGVARVQKSTRQASCRSITFPELVELLCWLVHYGKNYIVIIEAGWLNKSNWHLSHKDTKAVAAAKGNSAGRNHETGRKIAELCLYYDIPHILARPLKKIWKGKDGKITREEIAAFTGITGRNNQEERDALLLAWEYAGLPVKISSTKQQSFNHTNM